MTNFQKSTRTLNKLVSSHLPPAHDPFCVCIRDFVHSVLGITKSKKTLPQPPNSEELQSFQIHNINEIDINSLMVEDSVSTVQQFGNEKRVPLRFANLCLAELEKSKIKSPTFQWDQKGQSKWDDQMISVLIKHWFYAKENKAFQNYPIQSVFCNKLVATAVLERWLRGKKVLYCKSLKNNQNLSRIKNKIYKNRVKMANKLIGEENTSKLLPNLSCVSDTEEDNVGNLVSINYKWRHPLYSLFLHLLDINTINSIRDLKGRSAANRCLESQRKYAGGVSSKFPCRQLPENCYSTEILNDIPATHKITLDIQNPIPDFEILVKSIAPADIYQNAVLGS
ncbi:hypothetical protein BY996DRAFT_8544622 [Phakopsora pachyrhizi]|nr:hypothetical protein BY996DRAFT_6429042 [Phakopsora pachyrhizi]KAI8459258.1 hypothetical protein BY996DRAFT_8544622 [Phakopsora pachyrhizi]